MRIHSITRLLTSFHDRFSCWCSASSRTVPTSRARPSSFNGKTARKSVVSRADVQLAVHRRSARVHVGDIEQMGVRPARKTDLQRLAHGGMRAVASGNVGGLTFLCGSIRPCEAREHTTIRLRKAQQFRPALDRDAEFGQAIDQQALVLVLGKDQRVRKRAEACAHLAEDGARHLLAGHPEIRGEGLPSTLDDRVSEADLAVQLQRACLHGNRARRRPRLRRLVDDPHAHAQPRQPEG